MGLQKLDLVLHNPRRTYAPGDVVSGSVIVICDSAYNAQGLQVKLGGNEHVYWSETHYRYHGTGKDRRSERVITHYSGDEVLLQNEVFLAGNGNDTFAFPAGRHEYPFKFQLPPQLPATFSSSYGGISYEVQAVIKRSWYKTNDKVVLPITVGGIYDLNMVGDAALPGEAIASKTVCCLCCASGPIVGIVRTSSKGFVPGEVIPMEVDIQNNSSRDVTELKVSLTQVIVHSATRRHTYSGRPDLPYGSGYSKRVTNEVATASRHGVEPGQCDVWRGEILRVPHIRPTTRGRHIIDVFYFIVLQVVISSAMNLEVTLPVYIGTIPLRKHTPKAASRLVVADSRISHISQNH